MPAGSSATSAAASAARACRSKFVPICKPQCKPQCNKRLLDFSPASQRLSPMSGNFEVGQARPPPARGLLPPHLGPLPTRADTSLMPFLPATNFHRWVPACFLPGLARPPPRAQAPLSQPMQSPHTTHAGGQLAFMVVRYIAATQGLQHSSTHAVSCCPPAVHPRILSFTGHLPMSLIQILPYATLPHHTLLPAPSKGPCVAAAGYTAWPHARFFLEVFAVRAMQI